MKRCKVQKAHKSQKQQMLRSLRLFPPRRRRRCPFRCARSLHCSVLVACVQHCMVRAPCTTYTRWDCYYGFVYDRYEMRENESAEPSEEWKWLSIVRVNRSECIIKVHRSLPLHFNRDHLIFYVNFISLLSASRTISFGSKCRISSDVRQLARRW